MSSIDKFFGRKYHPRDYNCAHFAIDVLKETAGIELHAQFQMVFTGPQDRRADHSLFAGFRRIHHPVDNTFIIFRAPRVAPHVGIYLRGRVLHLQQQGVQFQYLDVVAINFHSYRLYQCPRN